MRTKNFSNFTGKIPKSYGSKNQQSGTHLGLGPIELTGFCSTRRRAAAIVLGPYGKPGIGAGYLPGTR